jgi:hypothetical protein
MSAAAPRKHSAVPALATKVNTTASHLKERDSLCNVGRSAVGGMHSSIGI